MQTRLRSTAREGRPANQAVTMVRHPLTPDGRDGKRQRHLAMRQRLSGSWARWALNPQPAATGSPSADFATACAATRAGVSATHSGQAFRNVLSSTKTLRKGARGRALLRDRSGDQSHLMRAPLATDLHTERVTVQAGVLFQLELRDQRAQRFRWIARAQPPYEAGQCLAIVVGKLSAPTIVLVEVTRALLYRGTDATRSARRAGRFA